MLHEIFADGKNFAVLVNPLNPSHQVDGSFGQEFADFAPARRLPAMAGSVTRRSPLS